MTNKITNFYPGTTKKFSVVCKIGGVAQDITSDAVTFRIKLNIDDTDTEAKLTKAADVMTQGATGVALFVIDPSDTKEIPVRGYYCDIVWVLAGGEEYVVYNAQVRVLERISDV